MKRQQSARRLSCFSKAAWHDFSSCTQIPTSTRTISAFKTHFDALHILLALFYGSRSDCQSHSIKSSLLTFLSVANPHIAVGGMNIPHTNTGYESNSELDVAGRFVPIVYLIQDDGDGNSQMSDTPLQLPASANVAPDNSALVTFSQAEGDLMRNVPQNPSTYPHQQFLDLRELINRLHNNQLFNQLVTQRAREGLYNQRETARRVLLHQQRELWQETMRRTIIMCRCKFDSSNKKQMRDCLKGRGICSLDFPGSLSSS